MKRQTTLKMIKSACWAGAAADALWAVALAWPKVYGILTGQPITDMDLPTRLVFGVAASLMAGWTVLLAWAAFNPVQRRAVMLFTAAPVLTGLMAVAFTGYFTGQSATLWIPIKTVLLFVAMAWGFHFANRIAKETQHEIHT